MNLTGAFKAVMACYITTTTSEPWWKPQHKVMSMHCSTATIEGP